ncbi:hypothetical protein C2G38_2122198 [Gigaspora rosea]|uniref:G-protein coupled receptors family 2 profile 2 domain-containing protein n=1 Tax=Gigaspora rosea TaxID=44941 RepID=A0A397U0P3_9GLOM|nr:hypothetical protein C2G38_2122198 [Gigaspora rosea]
MYTTTLIIIYFLIFLSLLCSIYVALFLYRSKKNYLIALYSASVAIFSVNIILSSIWKNELNKAPFGFCFFQAMFLQYNAIFQMACAFCFAVQTYAQLVLFHQSPSNTLRKFFLCFIILYPMIMTSILIVFSLRNCAVKPRLLNCDVTDPAWVRLFGWSGINQLLSIPGTILSGRTAYEVYKHMDLLLRSSGTSSAEEIITQDSTNQRPKFSRDPFSKKSRSYNITRAAAIRMVTFSLLFALINVFGCFASFAAIMKGASLDKGISSNDWVGATIGIFVFLVFGWPHNFKKVKQIWLNG